MAHSSTWKAQFEIVYREIHRADILTLDEVKKYSATRGTFAESESLIEKICEILKKVIKSLTFAQVYQTQTNNQSHYNVKYKVNQKVQLRVENIKIERQSQKLDWQKYGLQRRIKRIGKVAYCLDLLPTISIINIFYLSIVYDHKSRDGEKLLELQPLRLVVNIEI